jgi:hypothetical protein
MEDMTEAEAYALDEYYTNNPPAVDPSKARIRIPMVRVDSLTAEHLLSLAHKTRKTPEEIVSELVRKRIAATV